MDQWEKKIASASQPEIREPSLGLGCFVFFFFLHKNWPVSFSFHDGKGREGQISPRRVLIYTFKVKQNNNSPFNFLLSNNEDNVYNP